MIDFLVCITSEKGLTDYLRLEANLVFSDGAEERE